ncbi:MAG TPA: 30S ribosomal protein S12 methylthiotransferase RimO [Lachnospiraceae bacterium]|nr:30S ribosomal protein S12 methylthiotransferase RimO [Lachnospiraceae bacterium]
MTEKISFVSLGCDKNLVDSEVMLGLIAEKGYGIVNEPERADIIIINSCGFLMSASQEAIDKILEMADYKLNGSCKALIVTGCMAQRYKDEIFSSLPEVDAVVGTGDFEKIGMVIDAVLNGKKHFETVTDINNHINEENAYKRVVTTTGGFGYIKIAEGCNMNCTYCKIPSLRGKYRSRSIESLIKEASVLAAQGVRELIVVAQDTSMYGIDIYKKQQLHILLKKLSEIEDIHWIRLLYCYPENIYPELIDEMATNKKILHYIDMPVQHTTDRILKLMGRRSTFDKIRDNITHLRERIPDICLRTTLIAGFPGETEDDVALELENLKELEFDRVGVFTYSQEDGTVAAEMPEQIEEETKQKRMDMIMRQQMDISAKKGKQFIGKTLEVIIEGKIDDEYAYEAEKDNVYCGRSYRDCYEIDGFVFFESNDELIAGDFVNIKITDATDYDLIGEIVS